MSEVRILTSDVFLLCFSLPLCFHYSDVDGWDVVCYAASTLLCASFSGSDVTFVSIKTSMTWTQAQSYCRAHHTDLASVRNMTENQKIQVILPGVYSIWGWIGLFRDSWKWSDGSTSSFSFWKNGQPDNNYETCVAADFSQSGTWEDWPCDLKRAFICYGPGEC
uniref:C-type lectin domain-containing protein n=1 Tax=Sander lucioperca TaxID=283035 RepID=A0A8D0CV34_SANLU